MPLGRLVFRARCSPLIAGVPPAVVGDYFHADHQWAVGGTSLFYWAIGIL